MFNLPDYWNRQLLNGFAAKRYARLLFRGKQYVESPELNELQDLTFGRLAAVGNAALGAISLREGGAIVIDQATGTVRLSAATVWAGGYMLSVPAATLNNVPMVGSVAIGVSLTETVITELDDPQLAGIVPDTASQGQPLAGRIRPDAVWALTGDPFFPIFTLVDGGLPNEVLPPQDTAAELAVERHVRETHGSHIVEGFEVIAEGYSAGSQVFTIRKGTLRAEGRRVSRSVDQRYSRAEDADVVQVNGEPQVYPTGGVLTLNNGPIDSVQTVTVIKEVTATVTHQLAGGSDALANTPVYQIMSVKQGGTTYVANTDYKLTADKVDWTPAGAEPAPGSTYTVVYRYVATVVPTAIGRNTITLEAAVVGQPVSVNYRYKLRRIDVIAIDLDGNVAYLPGRSTRYSPVPPVVPASLAPLAYVDNLWGVAPTIRDVEQRKLTEGDLRSLLRDVRNLSDLVLQLSLERDIQERDPASRRGTFVDPFTSDLQRDLGIAQDAAIVSGLLMLPIDVTPVTVNIGNAPLMLPYVREPVLTQPYRTLSRKINQYQNFAPLPATVSINPAVDRWNAYSSSTALSTPTANVVRVGVYRPDLLNTPLYGTVAGVSVSTSSNTSLASTSTSDLPFLRPIVVEFTVGRMAPAETLQSVLFDGIDVTASVTGTKVANAQGTMSGTFTIPANVRAGTKEVVITGNGGSRAVTSFTGQGTLTVENYVQTISTLVTEYVIDPIAQSFVLDAPRQITGAKIEFTARGDVKNPVVLELRTLADGGLPSSVSLGEGILAGADIVVSNPAVDVPANWTEISLNVPAFTPANDYRAIALLTDDGNHAVAVAQLGDQSDASAQKGFDSRLQKWITQNPLMGDFYDGSTGAAWQLWPDRDLTCQIMAARYTALSRTINLGSFKLSDINAGGISDILVLLVAQQPSRECLIWLELVRASGEVVEFEPGITLALDAYLTETVTIRLQLRGTATLSPIVMPACQIVFGRLKETATYVSEAIALDQSHGNLKLRSVVEVATPGTSSVTVDAGATGAWTSMGAPTSSAISDGWVEREYVLSPVTAAETRQKITLNGTPKHRPLVRNLRIRATEI